jgi:hypothetical protein
VNRSVATGPVLPSRPGLCLDATRTGADLPYLRPAAANRIAGRQTELPTRKQSRRSNTSMKFGETGLPTTTLPFLSLTLQVS